MEKGEDRRRRLAYFIADYTKEYGYPPSVSDMAEILNTVKSNVHHHLRLLEDAGVLSHVPGRARSWVVSEPLPDLP